MADIPKTPEEARTALEQTMTNFEAFLKGDGSKTPSLRGNWIFLQIFATYGLWLPSTNADMQRTLNLTAAQAATYTWFPSMVGGYLLIYESSKYFFNDIFNKMLDLGNGLLNYAADVVGQDSAFTYIHSLLEQPSTENLETVLSLLTPLKSSAESNAKLAGTIKQNMTEYRTKLVKAQSEVGGVKSVVETDNRVSQATIDKLLADKDIPGSINQLQNTLDQDKEEYKQAVIIASTTPTYAWVWWLFPPIPVGLIAAGTVAGIYGAKAAGLLQPMRDLEREIKAANQELQTAVAVHATTGLAEKSLTSLIGHLDTAIAKVTMVQNAWLAVQGGLEFISGRISASLKPTGGPVGAPTYDLAALGAVQFYMTTAQKRWKDIQPTIDALMKDPVIKVEPTQLTVSDFISQVEAEIKK